MAKILAVSRKSHHPIEALMKLVRLETFVLMFHVRNDWQDMLAVSLNGKCKFEPKLVRDLSQLMTLTLTLSFK